MKTLTFFLSLLLTARLFATETPLPDMPMEIAPGESITKKFVISSADLAREEDKNAYLDVRAYMRSELQKNASTGYTQGLRVLLNGEELLLAANRGKSFQIGDGRTISSYLKGKGWTLPILRDFESGMSLPPAYEPQNSDILPSQLLLPLNFSGGTKGAAIEGEITFEAAPPDLIDRNITIESAGIVFLSDSELPVLN
ncbi:MAG: hypothetical protein ACK5NG_01900 [Chthoniobacterales bacterium]